MRLPRTVLLFIGLTFVSMILVTQRARLDSANRGGTAIVSWVTRPVEYVVVSVRNGIDDAFDWLHSWRNLKNENERLRGQVVDLHNELRAYRDVSAENERLRELLDLPAPVEFVQLPARVIGSDPTNWFRTIRIDRGAADGVRPESPVIAEQGVVGHVIDVTAKRATVLLLLDTNCHVAAILQDSREQGLIEGLHARDIRLTYVDRNTEMRVGEPVLTSGMGMIYPKGLLLGHVSAVDRQPNQLFLVASVKPAVDFARLEDVMVLLRPQQEDVNDTATDSLAIENS